MAEQGVVLNCSVRNEGEDFRNTWKDLYEVIQNEVSQTRRISYTVLAIL